MSIITIATALPIAACGTVVTPCNNAIATRDRHLVVGILSIICFILLYLLSVRVFRGKEGYIPVEKGTGDAQSVLDRSERPELGTSNLTRGRAVTVPPSSPLESSPPSSSKSQLEVGDVTKALPDAPSVASLHASSQKGEKSGSCVQAGTVSPPSQPRLSRPPSVIAVSIDDFEKGQDDEVHPEVRALVEEGKFTKEAVRDMKPLAPRVDTVIPNYNPILDKPRPKKMDDYLKKYRIFFVIDDSGSMMEHWVETRGALSEIAQYALRYYSDAIDIRFFNSSFRKHGVRGMDTVMGIFRSVSPSGGTPTGQVLKQVLDEQIDRLDRAQRNGTYSSEYPLDIIVLTDGVPNSNSPPAPVIQEAARRLKATRHHQNWIGIQFVQIGDNPMAEQTILSLIDCANNNHMVDTISYSFYKDEGNGKLTPQVLERIILGGLHPSLRSYYNQFRRKVNEKTSRKIY